MAPDPKLHSDRWKGSLVGPFRLPADSAIRFWKAHLLLWSLAVVVLALDLWSKAWAMARLPVVNADPPTLLFGRISLQRSLNAGALFGLGQGMSPLFIAASLLALLFVLYLFASSSRRQWVMHAALGFILAGALGNLYDRAWCTADVVTFRQSGSREIVTVVGERNADPVRLQPWGTEVDPVETPQSEILSIRTQGVVRDFIRIEPIFGIDIWRWVFNVADVALTIGVAALLLQFWWDHRSSTAACKDAGAPAT
ncbi:MAG: signal peptidase II [Phycisphaerae bacterium]|nr:signal peptidase II [Phycisphaerae bacterium]